MPKVGTRVATRVAQAIEAESGPVIAERAGLVTQAIYNYRQGRLPSRLAMPPLARGLRLSVDALRGLVEADRRDRKVKSRAGAA